MISFNLFNLTSSFLWKTIKFCLNYLNTNTKGNQFSHSQKLMLANNPFLVYSRKFIFPKCKYAKKTCAAILYITVCLFFSFISTLTTSLMNAHSHINSFLFCRLDEIITNKCLGLVKPHTFTVYLCKLNLSKRYH